MTGCGESPSQANADKADAPAADARFALMLYEEDLVKELGVGKDQRDKIGELADQLRMITEVETRGPNSKSTNVPFELLRRKGEKPEAFFMRKWAWFGSRAATELGEGERQRFELILGEGKYQPPRVKPHPRAGQGYIITWRRPAGESAVTVNVAEAVGNVDEALAALKLSEMTRLREAVDWLAGAPVEPDRRADVIAALKPMLTHRSYLPPHVGPAIERWAGPRDIPLLHSMLDMNPKPVRNAAVRALVRLPDPDLADELAKRFGGGLSFRSNCLKTLESLGAEAEPVAIGMLTRVEKRRNGSVCLLLSRIGGPKSLAALKQAIGPGGGENIDRGRAEEAIRLIEQRLAGATNP